MAIRTQHANIAKMVRNRTQFVNGNISGKWHSLLNPPNWGILPLSVRDEIKTDILRKRAVYVVYSFETPIAWSSGLYPKWTIPDIKYSNTTTHHQRFIRVLLDNPDMYT